MTFFRSHILQTILLLAVLLSLTSLLFISLFRQHFELEEMRSIEMKVKNANTKLLIYLYYKEMKLTVKHTQTISVYFIGY